MKFRLLVSLFFCVVSFSSYSLNIDYSKSKVTFEGEHAGRGFDGEFKAWNAQLDLPGSIQATFDLSSAYTGDRMYDGTLEEEDWFYTERFPEGRFISTSIGQNADGFSVQGELTLRDVTQPVSFELLADDVNNPQTLTATFSLDRIAFDIGVDSDPDAEWVSREITISLSLQIR